MVITRFILGNRYFTPIFAVSKNGNCKPSNKVDASFKYTCHMWVCASNSCVHCRLHLTNEWWREKRCNIHYGPISEESGWDGCRQKAHWLFVFWWCFKYPNCRCYFVCKVPLCNVFPWRGACLVLVFQQTLQTQTHTGEFFIFAYHFYFLFLIYFSAAWLQAFQCFWIWCIPWNICPVCCSSSCFQKWKNGLLHGAGTRFATCFYTVHRALPMKPAQKATNNNPSFASLSKNDHVAAAVYDIKDEVFWKAIHCHLYDVFPALKALRYCDSNIPAMDKILVLVKWADEALLDLQLILDDQDLFGSMRGVMLSDCKEELDEVFGETNTESNDESLRWEFSFFHDLFFKTN